MKRKKTEERLSQVAIKRDGIVFANGCQSHRELRAWLGDLDPHITQPSDIDGFLTSTGRFVDREEAKEVALKAKQLRGAMKRELLSSDVDW